MRRKLSSIFEKRKEEQEKYPTALAVSTKRKNPFDNIPLQFEMDLYRSLRENVPIIDASIEKIRRLVGSFAIDFGDNLLNERIMYTLKNIQVGAMSRGIDEFIGNYLEDLLTYGNAVGEIVTDGSEILALYNANLEDIAVKEISPLNVMVYVRDGAKLVPCKNQDLILKSAYNPQSGSIRGTSILRGLPFVSDILMKIYRSIGTNWDRIGNVRFAVSCQSDGSFAPERAKMIAEEWQKAMKSDSISDFVSVGDVKVQAIGGDIDLPDSETAVRQLLEQIVAKLGIPPFLLGFSWSSTERMSSQQADILTSELEAYRRMLEPVINRIVEVWMALEGERKSFTIEWDDITMQDEVDHASAVKTMLEAEKLREEIEKE